MIAFKPGMVTVETVPWSSEIYFISVEVFSTTYWKGLR